MNKLEPLRKKNYFILGTTLVIAGLNRNEDDS